MIAARHKYGVTLLALSFFFSYAGHAADYNIYVADKRSPAYAHATSLGGTPTNIAERTLHRALQAAAEILNSGDHSVEVLIAGGDYDGKMGAGTWTVPVINSPRGKLRLLGGWNEDFSGRQPFDHLTRLVTRRGRGGAFIELGARSRLAELVISGLVMDARPSNNYDREMNLLKNGTSTYRFISFRQLKTDYLVIADNIFANAPQVVFEPHIFPVSQKARVDIVNNFFLNNVIPIQELSGPPVGITLNTINLRHNAFVSNWPYNPDPTSSNVAAVGLYHRGGVGKVMIEGNLFAYNIGGAFQHDWPEARMPALTFRDNLFYQNAGLFDRDDAGSGVIVGKFGSNPRYMILDLETIEDDLGYVAQGNTVMDPGIEVSQMFLLDVDDEDEYADHYVEGYAPAMEVTTSTLPFALDSAGGYGVQRDRAWSN